MGMQAGYIEVRNTRLSGATNFELIAVVFGKKGQWETMFKVQRNSGEAKLLILDVLVDLLQIPLAVFDK